MLSRIWNGTLNAVTSMAKKPLLPFIWTMKGLANIGTSLQLLVTKGIGASASHFFKKAFENLAEAGLDVASIAGGPLVGFAEGFSRNKWRFFT